MITCFVNGVLQVGDCLEVNEIELEQTSPKGDGFIVCFYNMAVQIEACEEKGAKISKSKNLQIFRSTKCPSVTSNRPILRQERV